MRRALKQHLDRGKNRPVVVNDENARHGFPLRISFVQLKVTHFPISAKVEAGTGWRQPTPRRRNFQRNLLSQAGIFVGLCPAAAKLPLNAKRPGGPGRKKQAIAERDYEPFGLISV
jgi:hypothetical protein